MWWTFCTLWPHNKRPVTYAAFLFCIYPVFIQQPIAVTYHQVWIEYILYFLSIGTMIKAVQQRTNLRAFWGYTACSILTFLLNISISEYFAGVELLRPVLLWIVLSSEQERLLRRAVHVLKHWAPYLLLLLGLAVYRLSLAPQNSADANRPALLTAFLNQPASAALHFIQLASQDMIFIFVTAWYKIFQPTTLNSSRSFVVVAIAITIGLAAAVAWYLHRLKINEAEEENNTPSYARTRWLGEALVTGLLATFLGPLPVWITDRQAVTGLFSDRFSVVSMFGASLLLAVLVEWLVQNKKRALVIGILVGLAAGLHLRVLNDYRWSWTSQQRVYWQIYWRAPDIKPGTFIMTEGDVLPFVRPTFPLNLLYMQPRDSHTLSVWFYLLNREFAKHPEEWIKGKTIQEVQREFIFEGDTRNSLVLYYNPPSRGDCVWVLTPEDYDNPYFNDNIRTSLEISNLDRILPAPGPGNYPPEDVFGSEPEHGWCYYYEKADLARQLKDWNQVVKLEEEARSKGFTPEESSSNSPHEWMPFVEGNVYTQNWKQASEIVITNNRIDNKYRSALCIFWNNLLEKTPSSPEREAATEEVMSTLNCPK